MSQPAPESFHLSKNESTSFELTAEGLPHHPPGFRARRGLNWGSIGLLYASYYLCRYNFPLANERIGAEFSLNNTQLGWIISATAFCYGCGQMINGLITDMIGGRRAMLIGGFGTVVVNLAFGWATTFGARGWTPHQVYIAMIVLWALNGYFQAFGAPGMIKINAAWFDKAERGRFAGIFGFMINLGRVSINTLGPLLLGGFWLFWLIYIPPQHWRSLFYVPAVIALVITLNFALWVKETPTEAGFSHRDKVLAGDGETPTLGQVFYTIFSNPTVWIIAFAYACTGAVRQGIDQWFPKFMKEVHQVDLKSARFAILGFSIPIVATLGSLVSGYVSDVFFKGRRTPVAAALYAIETVVILTAAQFHSANAAIFFLVLIAFTANATHSILGTAAAMDIGGHKMAGFASGVIDSFQYFGGALAGFALGALIDHLGWGSYFYFMAPFGLIGAALMLIAGRKMNNAPPPQPLHPPGFEVVTPPDEI